MKSAGSAKPLPNRRRCGHSNGISQRALPNGPRHDAVVRHHAACRSGDTAQSVDGRCIGVGCGRWRAIFVSAGLIISVLGGPHRSGVARLRGRVHPIAYLPVATFYGGRAYVERSVDPTTCCSLSKKAAAVYDWAASRAIRSRPGCSMWRATPRWRVLGYLTVVVTCCTNRDRKFCHEFRDTLSTGGVGCTPIPPRSPKLERLREALGPVRFKEECLSKLILFGENSLRRVVSEFLEHYKYAS